MKDKKKLCGYYDYTVILTYLGMMMGFVGITFAIQEAYGQAIICLMIAGVCDMFDGTVAATKKRNESEKRFGIQIDSLSDLICFGVLPALIVYSICGKTVLALCVSCLYTHAALIRLAYFNVLEEERQQNEAGHRTSYLGLPVTSAALILPAIYIFQNEVALKHNMIYSLIIGIMTIAFIVPFKIKKPAVIGKLGIVFMGILEFAIVVIGGLKL